MSTVTNEVGTAETTVARPIAERRKLRWVLLGIAVLAVSTAIGGLTLDASSLFVFNSVLVACIGALALNMLMGTAGLVSMGSAAFLTTGAFGTVYLQSIGIPSIAAILLAAVGSAVLGLLVGLPALRLRGLELALASIAAFFIVLFLARKYQTNTVGAGAFIIDGWFSDLGLVAAQQAWAWVLFAIVSVILVITNLTVTRKFGRGLRLIRDHENAAHALGYPVVRYKMTIFAISSGLIGLQGALTANLTGVVSVDNFTILVSILYLQMILIGGLDSLAGAVIGAAIVVSLPTLTQDLVTSFWNLHSASVASAQIAVIVGGVLVIVFVVGSRDGLVGALKLLQAKIARTWSRRNGEGTADAEGAGTGSPAGSA